MWHKSDNLRDAVTELDERRNTREEGQKAAKAMETLDVSKAGDVKTQDVEFIVSVPCPLKHSETDYDHVLRLSRQGWTRRKLKKS